MPKIKYINKKFAASSQSVINNANQIIDDYMAQGFRLTLRQVYYQFVSRGLISNNQQEYKKLGSIINDARLAGLIDWEAIEDRTRNMKSLSHWNSPSEILEACSKQYRIDKWEKQEYRPQVWIEKDALVGVISNVCEELDITYFSCRGYTSQSEMWSAAQTLEEYIKAGQTPIILHFGDHDPSGIDMTRDIIDRLKLFMGGVKVERLALNMNQVQQYNPPPNFAKPDDSRYKVYVQNFGAEECWELDALEPQVIVDLVRNSVLSYRDEDLWEEALQEEEEARKKISDVSENI